MSDTMLAVPEPVEVCPVVAEQKWLIVGPFSAASSLLSQGQIVNAKMEEWLLAGDGGRIVLYRLSPPLFRSAAEAELQRIRALCGQSGEDIVLAPV